MDAAAAGSRLGLTHLMTQPALERRVVLDAIHVAQRAHVATRLHDTLDRGAVALTALHVRERPIVLVLYTRLVAVAAGRLRLVMTRGAIGRAAESRLTVVLER